MARGKISETGLIYCKNCCSCPKIRNGGRYFIDNRSGNLRFGFSLVFRVKIDSEDEHVLNDLHCAFIEAFGLPEDHYQFVDTFWYAYWDEGSFNIGLLNACEKKLNRVAKRHGIGLLIHASVIQPRPMEWINNELSWLKKGHPC